MLEPDQRQIEAFTAALFRHVRSGLVSLRTFLDNEDGPPPIKVLPVDMNGSGRLAFLNQCARSCSLARSALRKVAIGGQNTTGFGCCAARRAQSIALGLSVECDQNPARARALLERAAVVAAPSARRPQ